MTLFRRPEEAFTLRCARAENEAFPVEERRLREIMEDGWGSQSDWKERGSGRDSLVTDENGEGKRRPDWASKVMVMGFSLPHGKHVNDISDLHFQNLICLM